MSAAAVVHVVDDDAMFNDAVVRTLRAAGFTVASHFDAESLLVDYREDVPGCLLLDVRLSGMDGLALQEAINERGWALPIVFMTGHGDVTTSVAAFRGGAVDFLEKPFGPVTLLASVHEALARGARQRELDRDRTIVRANHARLTEREAHVMMMVISDRSNKEIARALGISPRTVDHHREHVMAKMGAHSLHDLIVMGLLCGLQELRLEAPAGASDVPVRPAGNG